MVLFMKFHVRETLIMRISDAGSLFKLTLFSGSHDEFSDISEVMNTGLCFEDISEEENATRSNAGAHVLPGKKPLEDELQSIVKLREEMRKQCTNHEFVTDTISM